MITKIPEALAGRLSDIRDKWISIGLSTEPVQREPVERALTKIFAAADKPRPRYVVMLKSPLEVVVAVALLRSKSEKLKNSVSDSVRDSVSDSVRDLMDWRWWWGFGQFDAPWLSFYDVMSELGVDMSRLAGMNDLCKCAGWSVLFWEWAFVSERPALIHRDERGRLHNEHGPALAYSDGFQIFAVHGVRVPADLVEDRASITVARIETERNAEVRRVMIELYGQARYLVDAGAEQVHADDYGVLFRKAVPDDEPIVMVKVVNSTAEPNGTFKDYFLRVPPTITTARGAVAWSFGKAEQDYAPTVET